MVEERSEPYVFVSYASADRERVLPVVDALERAGVAVWLDRGGIPGGASYASAIAEAIAGCAAVVPLASAASLASRNVRQELALGWKHERPYLPLLLEPVAIPREVEYWLEAAQWLEVLDRPEGDWLPAVLAALRGLSIGLASAAAAPPAPPRPETRYARSGDVSVAYQVLGDGPLDLVLVPGAISHVEWYWEEPAIARDSLRLAAFARLIVFDKRGTGLSDRIAGTATMEERMDDIRAVMDAAGSERAVIYGISEGVPLGILFASAHPERTLALVLYGGGASAVRRPDYPWGRTGDEARRLLDARARAIHETWGRPEGVAGMVEAMGPSMAQDARFVRWFATLTRLGSSPAAEIARERMNLDLDVRHILPAIRVPTLVLHRTGDRSTPVAEGRYLADHIPGARFLALPGDDHFSFLGDAAAITDAIAAFVSEVGALDEPDRVLATVLAATLVGPGTGAVAGDPLAQFRTLARRALDRYRGRAVLAGDGGGLLATFDGPARAVRCAQTLVREAATLGLTARVGLHTGDCLLGDERAEGPAVDLAAGVLARAAPGEVLVSSTVKDLVAGSGLAFAERGVATLAGLPGEWHLFAAQ